MWPRKIASQRLLYRQEILNSDHFRLFSHRQIENGNLQILAVDLRDHAPWVGLTAGNPCISKRRRFRTTLPCTTTKPAKICETGLSERCLHGCMEHNLQERIGV